MMFFEENHKQKKSGSGINLNDPLMKALKAVNFISGSSVTESDLKKHRAAMERAGRIAAPRSEVDISSFNVENIACEAIRPEYAHDSRYAIVYAHGGGYVCGGLTYARILAAKLAIACGFTVFTFDYRLAPENPYPAALNDGMKVLEYLTDGIYPCDHIILAGESAGGNLALSMALKLLEDSGQVPAHLLLFSPWTDMTATAPTYESNKDRDPILTKEYVMNASAVYIAGAGEPEDARFSPLFADLEGLPGVYIMAGRNGILLDDSIRLAQKINESGGRATLDIEENGWHVYQQMPIPLATRAMKRLSAYVSDMIYGEDKWKAITGTK